MKHYYLTLLVISLIGCLTSELHAQRGGRGGYGGGQRSFGTGYGGTMRTGYGGGWGTGYGGMGGGFAGGLNNAMAPMGSFASMGNRGYTGWGSGPNTGWGGTGRTGYGDRAGMGFGPGLGQTGTGAALGFQQAGTGFAPGAAGSNWAGRVGSPGNAWTGGIGTYHRTNADMAGQALGIRNGFGYHNAFNADWYRRYPRAWYPAAWGIGTPWSYMNWAALSAFTSYPETLTYYDYGTSVVFQGDQVYYNGESLGTQEEYAHHASLIAEAGRTAKVSKDDTWKSLGVFSVVAGDEQVSDTVFQLAIDKNGIIRGTAVNTITNDVQPIYGSVGTKSERAAWTVGDNKTPVYEAGIANLTTSETSMLVHFSKGNSKQYMLVRQEPKSDK
jgi:hypothetical protein